MWLFSVDSFTLILRVHLDMGKDIILKVYVLFETILRKMV